MADKIHLQIVTAGGRVLGVTAVAPTLEEAVKNAYEAAGDVHFENAYMRHDIGRRALAAKGE
jgi:phosphoribosylamine--glycine ligase